MPMSFWGHIMKKVFKPRKKWHEWERKQCKSCALFSHCTEDTSPTAKACKKWRKK